MGTVNLPCPIITVDGVPLPPILMFRCPDHRVMPNTALRKQKVSPDPYDVRQSVTQMHCEYQMMFFFILKLHLYTSSPTYSVRYALPLPARPRHERRSFPLSNSPFPI